MGIFLIILGFLCSVPARAQLDSPLQPQGSGSEIASIRSQRWSFLTLDVVPGFVKIRVDHEQVLGFSDKILLPIGNHWVEIIAPVGYQDTSFKITLPEDQPLRTMVRLRDIKTGSFAPAGAPIRGGGSLSWKTIVQSTSIGIGSTLALLAIREHILADESFTNYKQAVDQKSMDAWYDRHKEHARWRDIMAAGAAVGLGLGVSLWIFF